jgi:PST family polysaccharide transporter
LEKNDSSYNQILKSTAVFGGSQVFVILIGIIRAKIVAVLLGAFGVGVIGIYQSVIDMIRSGCTMGMDTAGVKEIAESNSREDKNILYKTVSGFNWWFRVSALLGLLVCVAFSYPVSIRAFGDSGFASHVAALSVCVFLAVLTTGRSTVLQGMRKISELVKSAIWGSVLGLLFTAPVYYFFGIKGIVPALAGTGLISFLCVEYYYRKLRMAKAGINNGEAFKSGLTTLKLGFFIVMAGFAGTASMFLVRAYVSRNIDIDAAGLFQSAWAITNIYLSLVLRSMGADFFPRLSAIANENRKVEKLVNEQSYIILVVASPVIVGMLLFAGFALSALYSPEFGRAGGVLRWQILGSFFKALGWPLAFIMLAKNRGAAFLATEIVFYVVYLLSGYLLFPKHGLDATGIAYLIAYAVYLPMVFFVGKSISGFVWNRSVIKMTVMNMLFIGIAFYIAQYYSGGYGFLLAAGILAISLIYAYFKLKKAISSKK